MGRFRRCLAAVLAAAFAILPAGPALAGDSVVNRADLDRALVARHDADEASRTQIRALLAREDVAALAQRSGLDLRRAQAAVATLDGEELRRLGAQAAQVDQGLAGGQTIQISLVAALLIIIIIILLVD